MSDNRIAQQDKRSDARVLLGTVLIVFLVFGIGRVPQASFQAAKVVNGIEPSWSSLLGDIGIRSLVNFLLLFLSLGMVALLRVIDHRGARTIVDIAIVSVVAGIVRVPLQVLFGYYNLSDWRTILIDGGTVAVSVLALLASAIIHVSARRSIREQERASARQMLLASSALDALVTEELRVRKDVAEGLHGTVQQSLVVLGVHVDGVRERLQAAGSTPQDDIDALIDIRRSLDRIRETDVRTLSQLLYPVGLELGAVAALRLLLQRLPGTIASTVHFSDAVVELEGNGNTALTLDRRLLIVRIAEEALSNALRHGRASAISMSLELDDGAVVLTFDDDGFGLGPDIELHGIARLRERLEPLDGTIELGASRTLGGTRLIARLPASGRKPVS